MKIVNRVKRKANRIRQRLYFRRLRNKYSDVTMIPAPGFLDNLRLIASVASSATLSGGAFVECGTWRGGMSAAMMEIGGATRKYAFFDSFEGLPPVAPIDGAAALDWQTNPSENYHDNCTASREEFERTLRRTGMPLGDVQIHQGWFRDTLRRYDSGPIAVLRLDGDWYESTLACLEALWDHVLPGGLVLLDDYGVWDGCTRAVHEFLASRSAPEALVNVESSGVTYITKRKAA